MRSKLNKYITAVHNSRLNAACYICPYLQFPQFMPNILPPDEFSGGSVEIDCGARVFKGKYGETVSRYHCSMGFHSMNLPVKPGIYMIVYIPTGDCYVGATNNIQKRINEHYNQFGSSQWKLNLCKLHKDYGSKSLKELSKEINKDLKPVVLEVFEKDTPVDAIRQAELHHISDKKPTLNARSYCPYRGAPGKRQ